MIEVAVLDSTQVAEARRLAVAAAQGAGFGELQAAQVALVATELATNLIKHGGGGRLLIDPGDHWLDLLALDKGRGMADVQACLADGYSTAGTLGHGLGAVRRASLRLDIVSWPQQGTAALARVPRVRGTIDSDDSIASVVMAMPGEEVCGDAWSCHDDAGGRTVFVVDGLGHGTDAALAANEGVRQFQRSREGTPDEILHAVHQAMRPTRGGAIAAARIDWHSQTVAFAGLGNIAAAVATPDGRMRRMVSHNGTAGHNARKIQSFEYPCADGVLIMHSDGLSTQWTLDRYPGLLNAHPLLLAGVLYRDQGRRRDDATVVVSRTTRPGAA